MPISSRLLFLRLGSPIEGRPCLRELERLNKMSSVMRRELDLPLKLPATVGLSGSEREFALVVASGGALAAAKPPKPTPDPLLLPAP